MPKIRIVQFMKKVFVIPFFALSLLSCNNDTDKASALLVEARGAMEENAFDKARKLVDSLRNTYPNELDIRRAALTFMDSLELKQARRDFQVADSALTFQQFECDDLKQHFTLEKQEKYQTTGYYVTNDYAGSKAAFSYFTEVEETGTLLAVSIDRTSGIKYDFTPVDIDFSSDVIPACPVSRELTEKEQASYEMCYSLAKKMQQLSKAKAAQEKYSLKIRFYEKKLSQSH